MCMGAFLSISYDLVSDLCFFAEEKDSSVGPPHTELWYKHRNNPLARHSQRLPEPKKFLYFVIPQNGNKKAVTVTSNRAKRLNKP